MSRNWLSASTGGALSRHGRVDGGQALRSRAFDERRDQDVT